MIPPSTQLLPVLLPQCMRPPSTQLCISDCLQWQSNYLRVPRSNPPEVTFTLTASVYSSWLSTINTSTPSESHPKNSRFVSTPLSLFPPWTPPVHHKLLLNPYPHLEKKRFFTIWQSESDFALTCSSRPTISRWYHPQRCYEPWILLFLPPTY